MAPQETGPTKRFGALLRHHRLALGLSQAKLASRAGVSKSQVALLELGKRRPSRQAALMRAGHAPVGRKASGSLPGLEKAMEALAADSRLSPVERLYIETLASAFIGWVREAVREGRIELPRGRAK